MTSMREEGAEGDHGERPLSPERAANHLLEECRMVLPGLQALLGFQLVAVFTDGFAERLTPGERALHLAAVALLVAAGGMLMAPAALHRQLEPRSVSRRFVRASSRLLLCGMAPLAVAMSADVYLVGTVALESRPVAAALAAALLALLALLWYGVPRSRRLQRLVGYTDNDEEVHP